MQKTQVDSMQNIPEPEKTKLSLGFVALTDCAPLVMAKELGIFSKYGLEVNLFRQNSWAAMRDKVQSGLLDAAQMLAPMPVASSLGLDGNQCDMITPMVLSFNGNAISISNELKEAILVEEDLHDLPFPLSSGLLKKVIQRYQDKGQKLRFATVHPFSCHHYQLLTWLSQHGVNKQQIDFVFIPPLHINQALRNNEIDGFCVGGPWNAKLVREGIGRTVITSTDIWPSLPEKVLGMTQEWYQHHPQTTRVLVKALCESCQWLSSTHNRFEAARILCHEDYLDTALDVIAPSLLYSCLTSSTESPHHIPNYLSFTSGSAKIGNSPESFYMHWILNQMQSAQQVESVDDSIERAKKVFRKDIYQKIIATQ